MKATKTKQLEDRKKLTDAIREKLKSIKLPKQLALSPHATITNLERFFDSHLKVVEKHDPESLVTKAFAERLRLALVLIGVNVNEIAKTVK